MLPAQYLWLPGLFSGRPHSLELSPEFYPGPDHQFRLFQTSVQDVPMTVKFGVEEGTFVLLIVVTADVLITDSRRYTPGQMTYCLINWYGEWTQCRPYRGH